MGHQMANPEESHLLLVKKLEKVKLEQEQHSINNNVDHHSSNSTIESVALDTTNVNVVQHGLDKNSPGISSDGSRSAFSPINHSSKAPLDVQDLNTMISSMEMNDESDDEEFFSSRLAALTERKERRAQRQIKENNSDNEILGDDVEEKTDNGGKIKSSDSTQSHPQKGKRKSNRKVWNGDSDSKKHSYKENSSEQREARPNSSIHDSNPSHDSDIPLTNSDLIGKKESMSMLQKEKETTIAAMGLLKRQIKKMKTDYPDKPRPQSIKLTIKGMKANLKEYKKNLKALIELEK